jgi:hypothetical protein
MPVASGILGDHPEELRAGAGDEREHALWDRLLGAMIDYPVDRQVAEQAGRLRAETGIRLPAALIAATALVHGLTVHTRNLRGFRRVPGFGYRPHADRDAESRPATISQCRQGQTHAAHDPERPV